MTATVSFDLPDEDSTRRLGACLARRARAGDVLALAGTLGTGKTTLARAFVRALAGEGEEVPSPTFTLVQTYDTPAGMVWHFDLYRLEHPDDALELGIEDAFADGISLIEWPQNMGGLLPRRRLEVALSSGAATSARRVTLVSHGQWDDRIDEVVHDVRA